MSEDAPDIFNCSICLEHFKKPKLLPCQHTFCESCLDTYIQSSTGRGDETLFSKWFLCPLCRQTVKPPDVDSKPREWASLMPINSMISSLMQTSEAGATVEESNESRNCGPCQRDEEISTGSFWCPNCLEFLCENCKKFHKRIKTLQMHKIIPIEEFDKKHTGSRHTIVAEIDEPCPDHVGESLKVFCLGHKTMCCVICLTTHHNECTEIKTLEEMAEQMEGDQTGAKFIDCLDDMKTRLGETIEDKQENKKHLNEKRKCLMDEVKLVVEQVKSNLDAFLEDFENKLTILNEQQNKTLSKTEQKIECLLKTLEYGEQMLKYLSRNCPSKQLFIAIEKFKVQILNHLQQLEMDSDNDRTVDYQIILGEILQKLKNPKAELELAQVEPKYEISKKPVMPIITELRLISDQEMQRKRQFLKADVSKFEAVKLWDVKGKGWISSGVFLDSGTLVCCDCANKFLKAFNENGSFICHLELNYIPLTLDVFENEIFVLAHQEEQVYTYTFKDDHFKQLQKMEIPYQSKGIVVVENKIAITNGQNIDILTVFGTKLQSIPVTVEDISSAGSFCYIAAEKSNIYYIYKDSLVKLSLHGKDFKSYTLPSSLVTEYAGGIAVDQNGNKLICDSKSDSICVLSKDCKTSCFLKTNVQPFTVRFEKNGFRFFVSNLKTDSDTSGVLFEVYEIQLKKE